MSRRARTRDGARLRAVGMAVTPLTALALTLLAAPAPAAEDGGASSVATRCRDGGWQQLMRPDGTLFTSTGSCVSYGARGGTPVPRNGAPSAVDDTATVGRNLSTVVDVLANDTDPDGDPLAVTVLDQPDHGTTTVLPDGTVSYTPARDYAGEDTFTYRVEDGRGLSDTARATLTVVDSGVRVVAASPAVIDNDITIEIIIFVIGLPAGHEVTRVQFTNERETVSFPPGYMSVSTRVPVTIARHALEPGPFDIVVVSSDGELTTAAVLPDGLTVVVPAG